jgi:acylphosphatase
LNINGLLELRQARFTCFIYNYIDEENQQMMEIERKHLKIFGRVQGVGFRYFTVQRAKELNINGWVKNMSDGTVETVIEGTRKNLDEMIEKLKAGPRSARVERVQELSMDEESEKLEGFSVRR